MLFRFCLYRERSVSGKSHFEIRVRVDLFPGVYLPEKHLALILDPDYFGNHIPAALLVLRTAAFNGDLGFWDFNRVRGPGTGT